jgi:hypothetical protein
MKTTADENRESAVNHIRDAITNIAEIIVHECEGSNDFNTGFKGKLKDSLTQLIEIRDKLT